MRGLRRSLISISAVACAAAATPLYATDGHFLHGVGAINSAMGGAGIAAPASLLGSFYLNPAGLLAFEGTRIEFGFEMFKPDRTLTSDAGPFGSGSTTSKSDWVPIPAMGFSVKLPNDKVALGVGMLGIGGFGVDYAGAGAGNPILAPRPSGFGSVYSNYQLMRITPTVAFAPTSRLWIGASADVNWASLAFDPAPVGAPAVDPGPDGVPNTADDRAYYSGAANADGAFGIGFQAGLIYAVNNRISVGASVQSPQYFQNFEFNTWYANPNLPEFGTPRMIEFNLDIPMVLGAGLSVNPTDRLQVAADFRYIFYENTDGFEIPDNGVAFNPDGSVMGFGWENIYTIHGGLDFRASELLSLRGGYNYTDSPIPSELSFINVPAPAIVQHHATFGIGIRPSPQFEISAAYYHAFENNVTGAMMGPQGPMAGTSVTSTLSENALLLQFSFGGR